MQAKFKILVGEYTRCYKKKDIVFRKYMLHFDLGIEIPERLNKFQQVNMNLKFSFTLNTFLKPPRFIFGPLCLRPFRKYKFQKRAH